MVQIIPFNPMLAYEFLLFMLHTANAYHLKEKRFLKIKPVLNFLPQKTSASSELHSGVN